jgi:hypothetical protein
MFRRFHSVMMWLLLLALPLQGFAAATMLHCGPNHHRMSEASAPTASHDPAAHRHHTEGTAADPHAPASVAVADPGAWPHDLGTLAKFKCSACAACCMGAALPAAALVFPASARAIAPAFFVPASHVGFFTDGPDRPPRLFLA